MSKKWRRAWNDGEHLVGCSADSGPRCHSARVKELGTSAECEQVFDR